MTAACIAILSLLFVDQCVAANPCISPGKTITGSSGHFSSPKFPLDYDGTGSGASGTCVWTINVPSGRTIKLTFHNFTLEPFPDVTDCSGQSQGARLTFTNVASNDARNPFRLCGQVVPNPVYSVSTSMQVTFVPGTNPRPGFNASFMAITPQELCPTLAQLSNSAGVISSPFYPRRYPWSQTCTWQINADKGKHIKLVTSVIDIENCRDCACDSLEVRDGTSVDGTSGKICGDVQSKTYYSTFESLWVQFISDLPQQMQYNGFQATYEEINFTPPVCPSDAVPLSGSGSFSSPNFPADRYPMNRDCSWLITVPDGKRVKLDFDTFAFDVGCACDTQNCGHVMVYDGTSTSSASLGKFCGTTKPSAIITSGKHMLVLFHSNFVRADGFNASYDETLDDPSSTVSPPITTTACIGAGDTINGSSGHFSSPNFPSDYAGTGITPFYTCTWTINVPSGHTVKLTFHNFTLEPFPDMTDCSGQSQGARLTFTNVASNDGRNPFRLCGPVVPNPVYSVSTSMQVTFVRGTNPRPGFNASFVAITAQELCPTLAQLSNSAGVISSPFYPRRYPWSQTCTWQINADKGKHIKLVTSVIDIEDCRDCACDSLEVRDGTSMDGTSGKICGINVQSKTYYSTLESLRVQFIADSAQAMQYTGFQATYEEINFTPPVCPSDAVSLSGSGSFNSPNFPADRYPVNMDCSWLITVPDGKRVKLEFHTFAFDVGCTCNTQNCGHVMVYDGNSVNSASLGKFCGTSRPSAIISSDKQMLVLFHSNFVRAVGFNGSYTAAMAGGARMSITFLFVVLPTIIAAALHWT